jgi:hypothetical protein
VGWFPLCWYVHPVFSTDVDFSYCSINYNSVILPKKLLRGVSRTARVTFVFSECTNSFRKERILRKHTSRLTYVTKYMNYYVCQSIIALGIHKHSGIIRAHNP